MRTLVIVACVLIATASAQEQEFHGRVVDAGGKPVAAAAVASDWGVWNGRLVPKSEARSQRTDASGRFRIRTNCPPRGRRPLMAVDEAGALAAAVALDGDHPEVEVSLRLLPMVSVRGEITSKSHGTAIDRYSMSIALNQAGRALVQIRCRGKFSLQLPPGDYQLSYRAPDCVAAKGSASVTVGATELDLGTIDLEPNMLSQGSGKAPPEWSVSDARGVSSSVKLADYRGKWVLLEFWGFW